ncbi:MAG: GerMN domain-containing protein [Candidatus Falkowbacteria bacterium]
MISNKKIFLILIAMAVLGAAVFLARVPEDSWICSDGQWVKHGQPDGEKPMTPCGEAPITNFTDCAAAGFPIMESYPRQCRTDNGKTFTEEATAENAGDEPDKSDLIVVYGPAPDAVVTSPLAIEGRARGYWFFEASFPVKLYDGDNNLLAAGIAEAESDWMTEDFVPFKAELDFDAPATETGVLVLEKDNPSGLPENADELRIPINFASREETTAVKVFWNNSGLDPEISCNQVFPTERSVPKTEAPARAALQELLGGVTESEEADGFSTSINSGVTIKSLAITGGTARVDFDDKLEFQVGGSCRVSAIRAQITETLKQFPTVKEVIISVNGRTEDALQP